MSFKSLKISRELRDTLSQQNILKPTEIQGKAIPEILGKKDIIALAKTGSGKTLSYVLPILMQLENNTNKDNRSIDSLIIVPTRELALQVSEVVKSYSINLKYNLKSLAVYGGVSINPQMKSLNRVNILIATPGRLIELVENNATSLKHVKTLVLDEADKLLNTGFEKELNTILSFLPKNRQNLLFSATLSNELESLKKLQLKNPIYINTEENKKQEEETVNINHYGYLVDEEKKGPLLRYIIKTKDLKQVLVFASSTYKADNIADKLRKNGIDARAMHGKKSQKARKDALKDFKDGNLRVLVATDLLGRGVDIEYLPNVINYELPRSPKEYIHRIGRTGRANRSGEAIALLTKEDITHFKVILKKMKAFVDIHKTDTINFHGY